MAANRGGDVSGKAATTAANSEAAATAEDERAAEIATATKPAAPTNAVPPSGSTFPISQEIGRLRRLNDLQLSTAEE